MAAGTAHLCPPTLHIAWAAFLLADTIGLFFAVLRTSRNRLLRAAAGIYIEIARGLPIVVVLYIVYFVPPQIWPGDWKWFSAYFGAVIGLGVHGGAILAEVFRSGIEALQRASARRRSPWA